MISLFLAIAARGASQKKNAAHIVKKVGQAWSRKKRLCVNYSQTVNMFTQIDAYPLPRIDNLVNKLSAYTVLSTFDLMSAYHQIPILGSDNL